MICINRCCLNRDGAGSKWPLLCTVYIGVGIILTFEGLNTSGRGTHSCYYYTSLQILGRGEGMAIAPIATTISIHMIQDHIHRNQSRGMQRVSIQYHFDFTKIFLEIKQGRIKKNGMGVLILLISTNIWLINFNNG